MMLTTVPPLRRKKYGDLGKRRRPRNHLEPSSPEPLSREAASDRSPGWSEAEPWVGNPQRQAPDGAQEQTDPCVSAESDVRRAFNDARNKTIRRATRPSAELLTEQYCR